jgi:hypothetical protein
MRRWLTDHDYAAPDEADGNTVIHDTRLSFLVVGDLEPTETIALLGITPAAVRRRGVLDAWGVPQQSIWRLTLEGPTSYEAPRLAEELGRSLIDRIGARTDALASLRAAGRTCVRWTFVLPQLMRFSFELAPATADSLAALAGSLVFALDDGTGLGTSSSFDDEALHVRSSVTLVLEGEALDPAAIVAALGPPALARAAPSARSGRRPRRHRTGRARRRSAVVKREKLARTARRRFAAAAHRLASALCFRNSSASATACSYSIVYSG